MSWYDELRSRLPYHWHQLRRWPGWHRPFAWLHRGRRLASGWLFVRPSLRRAGVGALVLVFLFAVFDRIGYGLWWGSYGLDSVPVLGVNFSAGYERWHQQRMRPLFVDRTGHVIGLYPIVGPREGRAGDPSGETYVVAAAQDVPEPWWRMVQLLEDGNRDAWYHINGIDLSQFLKIPYRYFFTDAGITGGSTLEMQLAKVMHRDTDAGGLQLLVRKARDILHAPVLSYYYAHAPGRSLKRMYATHVPLLYHGDEQGLTAASHLLFNEEPADLPLAEQALLAAAVKYHLGTTSSANWGPAKERAERALTRLQETGSVDPERVQREKERLRAMAFTGTPPAEPAVWAACTGAPSGQAVNASTQLQGRAANLALPALIEAETELIDARGRPWWRGLERIELTLDLAENCQAVARIDGRRERVLRRAGLSLAANDPGTTAYVAAAMADRAGRIRRFYSDLSLPYYHRYGWQQGRLTRRDQWQEPRQIGSVGKVVAAAVAGKEGDRPSTPYFIARRYKRIGPHPVGSRQPFQNFDGSTGFEERSAPGALIPAQRAFARSNNLAVMQRLDESPLGQSGLLRAVRDFGLVPPSRERATKVGQNLIVDIPMGNVRGSPRMLHRMIHAVGGGIAESSEGACTPHLVARAWTVGAADEDGLAWRDLMPVSRVCERVRERYFAEDSARQFVRAVLGGVVDCDYQNSTAAPCEATPSKHYGTAASALGRWSADQRPDRIRWHIAKTGTTSIGAERLSDARASTRLASVVGALQLDEGERYSYVLQVGSRGGRRHQGLGPGVYGGDVAALLRPWLAAVVEAGAGAHDPNADGEPAP